MTDLAKRSEALILEIRSRVNDAPLDHEYRQDRAEDLLEEWLLRAKSLPELFGLRKSDGSS